MGSYRSRLLGGLFSVILCWTAQAQPGPLVSCIAVASPTPVYASGIAELLSDIVVQCRAGGPTFPALRAALRLAVTVELNVSVTNSVDSGGGQLSDAVLVVNGNDCAWPSDIGSSYGSCGAPLPFVQDPQRGRITGDATLDWSDVTVPFPGALALDESGRTNPAISTLRIRGIRGNASQLRLAAGSSPAGPPVAGSVSIRSDSAIVLKHGAVNLAHPVTGLGLAVAKEESAAACLGDERGSATVHLREGFANAFRARAQGLTGLKSTRILLEFRDIPDGVSVRVPPVIACNQPRFDGSPAGIPDALSLGLVTGHSADGAGGSANTAAGGTGSRVSAAVSEGGARVVYEVLSDDPSQVEDCHVPVLFETDSGRAANARATVTAGLAPRSGVFVASDEAPLPRFAAALAGEAARVDFAGCSTTLMFPFVSNQAGFTTGVVITHGSQQALTGIVDEQAGSCDLHYYGSTAEGEGVLLVQHSTPIDPGEQLVFTLSGGNPARNILGTDQFQGYLIATCGYPHARGYVFISDGFGGIADLAMGYLAPVVPRGPDGKRAVLGEEAR